MSPETEESIRCTVSGCSCVCFKPGSDVIRSCDRCSHSWVAHALEKLQPPSSGAPVEVALPGSVLDLSSLVLYGTRAIPVRLKILLDRLFSVLSTEQVVHIIHTLGWNLGDYIRGYMLQGADGKVLDRWFMATPEEEALIFKQFLRFGETRPIVELMALPRLTPANRLSPPGPRTRQSNTRPLAATGRETPPGNLTSFWNKTQQPKLESRLSRSEKNTVIHHFESLTSGLSGPLPPGFPSSTFHFLDMAPPAMDLAPSTKVWCCLQRPSRTAQREGVEPGSSSASVIGIKPDPDAAEPALPPSRPAWRQEFRTHGETTLKLASSLSPSILSSSSSSSSSSTSSLLPLPPSLCSSSGGGRKGRVVCGVCAKSFYDKGTLKIHYNAVHLQIKHRCTVKGCKMVFSSLRSRNRHSANPNPRLHTHTHTNTHITTHSNTPTHTHPNTHTATQTEGKQNSRNDTPTKTHTRTHIDAESTAGLHTRTPGNAHSERTLMDTCTDTTVDTHRGTQQKTHTHSDTHDNAHTLTGEGAESHTVKTSVHSNTHPDTHCNTNTHWQKGTCAGARSQIGLSDALWPHTHSNRIMHTHTHAFTRTPSAHVQGRLSPATHTTHNAHTTHTTHSHLGSGDRAPHLSKHSSAHLCCSPAHAPPHAPSPPGGLSLHVPPPPLPPCCPCDPPFHAASLRHVAPVLLPRLPESLPGPCPLLLSHGASFLGSIPAASTRRSRQQLLGVRAANQEWPSCDPSVAPLANQPSLGGASDPVAKKKPRKSSTPLKIQRAERTEEDEEEEGGQAPDKGVGVATATEVMCVTSGRRFPRI